MAQNGHLRVGTTQRERTMEVLRNAAADERITFEELESRVPRALGARTRDDLAAVLDDLLSDEQIEELVHDEAPAGAGPGWSAEQPLVLESANWWSELTVSGDWEVPPFLEIVARTGGVRLDFSRATPRAALIDVSLLVSGWGTTVVIVPRGWGVDTLGYQGESSYFAIDGVRSRPDVGKPRVILHGRTSGTVQVRYATARDLRRSERHLGSGGLVKAPRPDTPELAV